MGDVNWDADYALTRMGVLLDSAARFIENDRLWAACITLRWAHRRCDGEGGRWWNLDFVSGEARYELAGMIEELMIDLGCRIYQPSAFRKQGQGHRGPVFFLAD